MRMVLTALARLASHGTRLVALGLLASAAHGEPNAAVDAAAPSAAMLQQVGRDAAELVVAALNFIGVRYVRGGSSEQSGFDCSGFTRHVFGSSFGLVLPRQVDAQASAPGLVAVQREDLQPGDLVFFNTSKRSFSHVGIYIGHNRFVHAPRPGAEVRTEDMGFAYWKQRFTGARRAELAAQARIAEAGGIRSAETSR
jgi:cell wall-associated NlpC family hydrolase